MLDKIEQDNNSLSLSTPKDVLEHKIMYTEDIDELKNVIELFNLNIKKKDIIRAGKLSELQDKIYTQMEERLDKHAGEFSNKDLLDYYKVVQDTISKSDIGTDDITKPAILVNNQSVNVSIDGEYLNKESKKRVAEAVKMLLEASEDDIIEEDVIDISNIDAEVKYTDQEGDS